MNRTAALALIASQIVAVINREIGANLTIEVESNIPRGLFLAAEGDAADLDRLQAFVAAHLSSKLAPSDRYPADEDGAAMDFYTVI